MSLVYFASDLHLGHGLAARCRGFGDDIDAHDEAVISSLEDVAHKRGIMWILGDVCMSVDKMPLLNRIKGRLRLVRGNHDVFKMAEYQKYFEEIHGFLRYKEAWLSHCPIHPQEMYRCKLNVHGHIHKNTNSPELPLPYFNVNWDFWGRPVSLEELRAVMTDEHTTK